MFALCFPAYAGKYVLTSQTGGTVTTNPYYGPPPPYGKNPSNYGYLSDGSYGGSAAFGGSNASINCTGAITTVYTWKSDSPNDPAPKSVIVSEQCTASYYATIYGNSASVTPGSCDNGLGSKAVVTGLPNVMSATGQVGYQWNATSSGTRYSIKGGSSFTVTCSPSASCFLPSGPIFSASVSYRVSISPIIMTLTGFTLDANKAPNYLIGQGARASLSGGNFTSYSWTIPGDTFKSWGLSADESHGQTTYLSAADTSAPSPHWFWKKDQADATVSCNAQVLMPDGTSQSVSAEKKVQVLKPSYFFGPNVGYTVVKPDVSLNCGDDAKQVSGIKWTAAVGTPDLFVGNGTGTWRFLQLCSLDRLQYTFFSPLPSTVQTDGLVLDAGGGGSGFPYQGTYAADSTATNQNKNWEDDNPDIGMIWGCNYISSNDSFKTYLMYSPPGTDVQWVPLAVLSWAWCSSSSKSITNVWSQPTPGVYADGSQPTSQHPEWTNIFH